MQFLIGLISTPARIIQRPKLIYEMARYNKKARVMSTL